MNDYTQKDIERVCRLGQVSRIKAIELLRRYGGKPERVMTEHFGRARVYIEPLCVCDIKAEQTQRLKHAAVRLMTRRVIVTGRMGGVLFAAPLWPTLALAAVTMPFSAMLFGGAILAGCRFSLDGHHDTGVYPDMA